MANSITTLRIKKIELKHFRCFQTITLDLSSSLILLEGGNGAGKTSLLEALYYGCYLRSFRTHIPRELSQFGTKDFFIRIDFDASFSGQQSEHDIQIGFAAGKRLVKIDRKAIASYKELMDYYRIVSLTEDDLELIKGSPEIRRSYIDQVILLYDPLYAADIRALKAVAHNRNIFLLSRSTSEDMYDVLTQQLWQKSVVVRKRRQEMLEQLKVQLDHCLATGFAQENLSISLTYKPKLGHFDDLILLQEAYPHLKEQEMRQGRSLFGAHLDDIHLLFQDKQSRMYASRGQQKLAVLLLRIAQVQLLCLHKGAPVVLLDDFMTDFDQERAQALLNLLESLDCQLIFTSPNTQSYLNNELRSRGAFVVPISSIGTVKATPDIC